MLERIQNRNESVRDYDEMYLINKYEPEIRYYYLHGQNRYTSIQDSRLVRRCYSRGSKGKKIERLNKPRLTLKQR